VQHDLVRQAKAGDQDAFASLATASAGRLYRVAYRIVRDPDDARDATLRPTSVQSSSDQIELDREFLGSIVGTFVAD
jgi:hypothetical protein